MGVGPQLQWRYSLSGASGPPLPVLRVPGLPWRGAVGSSPGCCRHPLSLQARDTQTSCACPGSSCAFFGPPSRRETEDLAWAAPAVSPTGIAHLCRYLHQLSAFSSHRLHIPQGNGAPLISGPSLSLSEKYLPSHHLRYYCFQEAFLGISLPASQ